MPDIFYFDEAVNACNFFNKKLKKFTDYIKYLENDVPPRKRTKKENELVNKYGKKNINKPS